MAKAKNRKTLPFTCEHCHSQIWLSTNPTNNQTKNETKKMTVTKFCRHADCRTHRTFTQAKPPMNKQQGGKKKH